MVICNLWTRAFSVFTCFQAACILLTGLRATAQASAEARLDDATVALSADCPNGPVLSAGVIVALQRGVATVLTVAHVASCRSIHVRYHDGDVEPGFGPSFAKSAGPPERYDIGIIHASAIHVHSIAQLSSVPYVWNEHLTIVGYGDGFFYQHSDAKVIDPNPITLILACRDCRRGDSGAGVFDDAGNLVGIIYGQIPLKVRVNRPGGDARDVTMTCWLSNTLTRVRMFLAGQH
jgi:hypothetical protein